MESIVCIRLMLCVCVCRQEASENTGDSAEFDPKLSLWWRSVRKSAEGRGEAASQVQTGNRHVHCLLEMGNSERSICRIRANYDIWLKSILISCWSLFYCDFTVRHLKVFQSLVLCTRGLWYKSLLLFQGAVCTICWHLVELTLHNKNIIVTSVF